MYRLYSFLIIAWVYFTVPHVLVSQKINLDSKEQIGSKDSLNFVILKDLKTDKHGNIYLSDLKTVKVYKFSSGNKLLAQTGRSGRGPGEFLGGPSNLAISKDKLVVFDLSTSKRAEIFDPNNLAYKTSRHLKPAHYTSLNNNRQLLMNYHNYLNETYLHVYDFSLDSLFSIHQKDLTPYPRLNRFEIFRLPNSKHILIVYLYYNRVDILNEKIRGN